MGCSGVRAVVMLLLLLLDKFGVVSESVVVPVRFRSRRSYRWGEMF